MVRRKNIVIYFPQFTDNGTLSNSAVTVKVNWQTGGDIVQETPRLLSCGGFCCYLVVVTAEAEDPRP